MASQQPPPPDPSPSGLSRQSLNAFVVGCVAQIKGIGLQVLVQQPPKVSDFLEAYVIARCLPIVLDEFDHPEGDDWDCDEFGEEVNAVVVRGELFLNERTPRSMFEAALMLELIDSMEDGPCCHTNQIAGSVVEFLIQQVDHAPLNSRWDRQISRDEVLVSLDALQDQIPHDR